MGLDDIILHHSSSPSTESLGEASEISSVEVADYEPTEEEQEDLCRAFTLLDVEGDGVIDPRNLESLLVSWGRLPFDDELAEIMSFAKGRGCEGALGMSFPEFRNYILKQLRGTTDEGKLREAFQIFDTTPPTGRVNVRELRHYLKHKEMKLTDDEIDFLFKEEDYWMLDENYMLDYEEIISKILNKPSCRSKFLNC